MNYKVASRLSYTDNRPFVREHVLVAEKKLGRKLKCGEVVHHIDANKKNNDESNLIVFASNADHSAFHKGAEIYENNGIWYSKKHLGTCETCGKTFDIIYPKKYSHIYCSAKCSQLAKRKLEISIDELFSALMTNNGNFIKVGKMFNVSDNAIRKRCKLLGIPSRSSDYKHGGLV